MPQLSKLPRYNPRVIIYAKLWWRSGRFDVHHIKPKSRKGKDNPSNLIRLDRERHIAWHLVFGLMTFEEVILFLQQRPRQKINLSQGRAYYFLFGHKTFRETAKLLKRALRFQRRKEYC